MNSTDNIFGLRKSTLLNAVFVVMVLLILVNHVLLFLTVNTYIDSDQPFMWIGARDYAKGQFYEPRFYGQNYNSFLEPLFAVPLLWMKVPIYYALPVATHFLALFPFLFTAFYLFSKGKNETALVVLSILLCMTPAYDVMTSIPRGFVTGAFFGSFLILSFLSPTHHRYFLLNAIVLTLGYFINPNSILVSIPFFAFMFFHNYREKAFYYALLIAAVFAFILNLVFNRFYDAHPNFVIYGLQHSFSLNYFIENILHPEQALGHINFFFEEHYHFLLICFLIIAVSLLKSNVKAFYAFILFAVLIILSFFSGKTREGSFWPFYSYSRMYIGIPVVIALFVSLLKWERKNWTVFLVVISILFSGFKFMNFKAHVLYHTSDDRAVGVHLVPLKSVLDAVNFYGNKCKENNTKHFLISNTFWLNTYLTYGGPAIDPSFPDTEESRAERRYWVREYNKQKVFRDFMLLSVNTDFDKVNAGNSNFRCRRLDDYGLFLISENKLKNSDFITVLNRSEKN